MWQFSNHQQTLVRCSQSFSIGLWSWFKIPWFLNQNHLIQHQVNLLSLYRVMSNRSFPRKRKQTPWITQQWGKRGKRQPNNHNSPQKQNSGQQWRKPDGNGQGSNKPAGLLPIAVIMLTKKETHPRSLQLWM